MTGPEHYRKAEGLLESASIAAGQYEEHGWQSKLDLANEIAAEAQVHAVLALAAATAIADSNSEALSWREVAS